MREAQHELRICLKEAYWRNLENQLGRNQVWEVWNGMKTITGCSRKSSVVEGNTE